MWFIVVSFVVVVVCNMCAWHQAGEIQYSLEATKSGGKKTKKKLKAAVSSKDVLVQQFLSLRVDFLAADRAAMEDGGWRRVAKPSRRVAEIMAPYVGKELCQRLCLACRSLNFVEMNAGGAGDAARVGDRFLSPVQQSLYGHLKENLVEGLRSGIQTSFYTCDYTTKPSLTCGPVLKHLTTGMQRLEQQMNEEAAKTENEALLQTAPVAPLGALHKQGVLSPEQQEARRRLCRLWTSANHAVMHGHCLMAIQLLTGREAIKTHVFWRIMLKRVLWGIFEEMRRLSDENESLLEREQQVALTDIGLATGPNEEELEEESALGCVVTKQHENVEFRTTSFYEDYLHRGEVEPLASMNFYVYAMHVDVVHFNRVGSNDTEYEFVGHYSKAKHYVQVIHVAPRIPYLHGVTMPTKEKDMEMWAAVHVAVLRKHCCSDPSACGKAQAVKHIRKIPAGKRRRRVVRAGTDRQCLQDASGILGEWKATEAEMQTLADRADATWRLLAITFFKKKNINMSTFHVISFGENARHTRFVAGKIERGQALCNRFSVEVFHESHVGSGVGWDL